MKNPSKGEKNGVRTLSGQERVELRAKQQQLLENKMQLAQLVIDFEGKKAALIVAIDRESEAFLSSVRTVAQKHGVDPDGSVKWNLDLERAVFHRLGAPSEAS